MKRLKKLLSLLLISMIFTSCVKGNTSQSEINLSEIPSTIESDDDEELEEIIFNPGDKTKLTYATMQTYGIPKRLQDSINIYLDSIGKDYYIDFKLLSYENYVDDVRELAKNGDVDILYTGFPWEEGYSSLIEDGTILNLDGFLSSDEGGELYNSVPDSIWRGLKIDGSIYGACGYVYSRISPPSYYIS